MKILFTRGSGMSALMLRDIIDPEPLRVACAHLRAHQARRRREQRD